MTAALLLVGLALAAPKEGLVSTGEIRYIGTGQPDLLVDDEGTRTGGGVVLDQRIRAALGWNFTGWRVGTEWDLFSGQLAGDPWDLNVSADQRDRDEVDVLDRDSFVPRKAFLRGRVGIARLEAGLLTSHWGLGMLANDGAQDPYFGRNEFGDRVLRVMATTAPFGSGKDRAPVFIALGADRVVEDDSARWADGQAAYQVVGAVMYQEQLGKEGKGRTRALGLYGVWRQQDEPDGRRTTVGVTDLYGDLPLKIGDFKARLAVEAAGVMGSTERANSYNSPDGLKLSSAGFTGLGSLTEPAGVGSLIIRSGWSSADGDGYDDASHDFSFDRDFDVGMVLFDEVQGAYDAGAWRQLTDPENSGEPALGVDSVATEGAARRVAFFQPIIRAEPKPFLRLDLGALFAWSTGPIGQSFQTYRNGGVPANFSGETTEAYRLGTELDWSLTLGDAKTTVGRLDLRPALVFQGGHLFMSPDLAGENDRQVDLYTATGRVRW